MKKKVYISVPMKHRGLGYVLCDIYDAKKKLSQEDYETFDPISINHDNECEPECLGKDIERLLKCDAIYFCEGWQTHSGCLLEFAAAKLYNKEIIFE